MKRVLTMVTLLAIAGCAPAAYEITGKPKPDQVDGKPMPVPPEPGNPSDDPDDNPAPPPGNGPGDSPRNEPVPTPGTPGKPDPCNPGKPDCPGKPDPNNPGQGPNNPGQTPTQQPIPPVQQSTPPFTPTADPTQKPGQCNLIRLCSRAQLPQCSQANDGLAAYVVGYDVMFRCDRGQWKEIPLPESWPQD